MKKILSLFPLLLVTLFCFAQTQNYNGVYGYSEKPQGDPPKDKANDGPNGTLTLIRMENNKYRFWLDINKGWPGYEVGATDGTITFVNGKASFDNTYEDSKDSCVLVFKVYGNKITISGTSAEFNCGFGNGVSADGEYKRLSKQPAINNAWLKGQYNQSPKAIITVNKAQVYQDENCLYPKNQFFVKNDALLSIAETQKSIYIEFITPSGKFIWGWIKRSAVRIEQNSE